MIDFDGFRIQLLIDEDGVWIAHLVEMPNISAEGETPEKAIQELRVAWRLVKESYPQEEWLELIKAQGIVLLSVWDNLKDERSW